MTKSELIEQVSETLRLPNGKAEQIVNCIFDSMIGTLQDGEGIEIRGFGSFTVREYKSYEGRNPRTGESVHVAAKRLPFFKVGKDLRERVNDSAASGEPLAPDDNDDSDDDDRESSRDRRESSGGDGDGGRDRRESSGGDGDGGRDRRDGDGGRDSDSGDSDGDRHSDSGDGGRDSRDSDSGDGGRDSRDSDSDDSDTRASTDRSRSSLLSDGDTGNSSSAASH